MIGEIEIGGVFLPAVLVTGVVAFMAALIARRVLRVAGVYALVWHAGLFDLASFTAIWGIVAFISSNLNR